MVPLAVAYRASTASEAARLSAQHDFDFIPMPLSGQPSHIYSRAACSVLDIDTSFLISDSTPITKLASLFQTHGMLFVLSARDIVGLVHMADLNNPTCKLPYFALFEDLERELVDRARAGYSEVSLDTVFGAKEASRLRGKVQDKDVLLHPLSILHFSELLKYCCAVGITDYTPDERKLLKDTRNDVAHGVLNLLPRPHREYLERLLKAEALCRDKSRLRPSGEVVRAE